MSNSFIVVQLGARMHYAVPRILSEAGLLERFYTDFCASKGWPRLLKLVPAALRPDPVRRLLGRAPAGVAPERIVAFNAFGREYARRRRQTATPTGQTAAHLWAGSEFCRQVLACGFGTASAVYTFNTAGLEVLRAARQQGLLAVMEQTIAPKRIEVELLETEHEHYFEWEADGGGDRLAQEIAAREAAEWDVAHLILCACEFVRDSIAKCGGPVEKCVVVPYGVELPSFRNAEMLKPEMLKSENRNRPLRVLTVGAVGLRKGSPYVLAAAKQLKGRAVFRMVGSIGVTRQAEAQLRAHLELTGPVPRSEIAKHFTWADVFLFPSLCEGSATVTYEAMGHGLPVVCTPNTGSVVRDGVEGFIVPVRDVNGMVTRLETLAKDSAALEQLSINARLRAKEYTLAGYSRRLLGALRTAELEKQRVENSNSELGQQSKQCS